MKLNIKTKIAPFLSARRKMARRLVHAGFCAVVASALFILALAAGTESGTEEYIALANMAPEMYSHIFMSVLIMSGGSFALDYASADREGQDER